MSRQRQNLESQRDELVFQIKSAEQKQTPELIKKEIRKTEGERDQLNQQLRNLDNNLYLHLQKNLQPRLPTKKQNNTPRKFLWVAAGTPRGDTRGLGSAQSTTSSGVRLYLQRRT